MLNKVLKQICKSKYTEIQTEELQPLKKRQAPAVFRLPMQWKMDSKVVFEMY
jgi:hypothetical protein